QPEPRAAIAEAKEWLNVSRPLTEKDLEGRIILLDFWCFCCINCMHVIPDLKALEKEFGNKLLVIGVHSAKFANERETANIREAVLRYGLEHPVVNDASFALWKALKVDCWPTLMLLNPKGAVERTFKGERHLNDLRREISRLIEQTGDALATGPLPIALERDKLAPSPLAFPGKITYAKDKALLFVSDSNHHRIVGMKPTGEVVLSIGRKGEAGAADGDFDAARFRQPQGLAYADGVLYVADTENHLLRKIDLAAKTVTTLAGTGKQGFERKVASAPALKTPLSSPWDVAVDAANKRVLIAIAGQHQLWSYALESATLDVVAGSGAESCIDGEYPKNALAQPSGISLLGERLYFMDSEASALRVLEGGKVTTLLGKDKDLFYFGLVDGTREKARLQHPLGVCADEAGVFITDSYNHAIRRFDPATGAIETLAGNGKSGFADGVLGDARFAEPAGLVKVGSKLYVADTNNQRIRVVDLEAKKVSTIEVRDIVKGGREKPVEGLPLVETAKDAVAADSEVEVHVKLPAGHHFNTEAESWLTVWRPAGEGKWVVVADVTDRAKLLEPIKLPALGAGWTYRLQGSFSYCAEGEGAVCRLKSWDRTLTATKGAGASLELALPAPK
ncbi:MAG TPA: thioredoxin-like domain-containing protein, partial [Planctomycetota bacterium]|nr:thioredoxin-like domain-containing protein [Planctomycetota bacterium]